MAIHAPRNRGAFALAVLTVVFGLVGLVLDAVVNYDCAATAPAQGFGSVYCAASGVGIAAGAMGIVFGLLAMMWLMVAEMSERVAVRALIVIGLLITSGLAISAGVLNAYVSSRVADNYIHNMMAAASAMHFVLTITSFVTAILCWTAPLVLVPAGHTTSVR